MDLAFKPTFWEANPLVEETVDQVALKYGPLVYCIESNDLPTGVLLKDVAVSLTSPATFTATRERIGQTPVLRLTFDGLALQRPGWDPARLYRPVSERTPRAVTLKAVPYYTWGNRGDTEMSVWIPAR